MQILSCFIKPSVLKSPIQHVIRVDSKDPLIHLTVTEIYDEAKFAKLLENIAALRDDENTNHLFDCIQRLLIKLAVQLQKRLPLNHQTLCEAYSHLDSRELVRIERLSLGCVFKVYQDNCRE